MRALFRGEFVAFGSVEVAAEYQLALRSQSVRAAAVEVGLHPNLIHDYAQAVAECLQIVEPGPSFRTSDESDDKFTAASSGAHADYIVSGDHSLLDMREILEAHVVTPEDFERVLASP